MTAKVTTFANQKGGVGKTTLVWNVAARLAERGLRVKLIDCDPQESATQWTNRRHAAGLPALFALESYRDGPLHTEIEALSEGFDHVLIDTPGIAWAITPAAIAAADVVVIPVQPSPLDVWASAPVAEMIRAMQAQAAPIRAAYLLNRRRNARITKGTLTALKKQPFPTLESTIGDRAAFPSSAGQGQTVHEYEPLGAGSTEVSALTSELLALHGNAALLTAQLAAAAQETTEA